MTGGRFFGGFIPSGSCGLSFPVRMMRPSLVKDQIKLRVAIG